MERGEQETYTMSETQTTTFYQKVSPNLPQTNVKMKKGKYPSPGYRHEMCFLQETLQIFLVTKISQLYKRHLPPWDYQIRHLVQFQCKFGSGKRRREITMRQEELELPWEILYVYTTQHLERTICMEMSLLHQTFFSLSVSLSRHISCSSDFSFVNFCASKTHLQLQGHKGRIFFLPISHRWNSNRKNPLRDFIPRHWIG